jgi:signal transduction histidine kinase
MSAACEADVVRDRAASGWGGIAHVFLAIALCLPLVAAAAMVGVSLTASDSSALTTWLLALVAAGFVALVVWASLLPPVRQVELSTARALLDQSDAALPDVRLPGAWASRRRGAAWLALLCGVGLVVATAILYLVPFGISLLFSPMSDDTTVSWPLLGPTHSTGGWSTVWLVGLGLLALVLCLAVVGVAARLLAALAPRVLGPTLTERVVIDADRERALARANALARDLHDRLGHTLTAMTVQATVARRLLATDPDAAERAMAAVEDLGRRAQEDVDSVVRTLRDGAPGSGAEVSDEPVDLAGPARTLAHEATSDVELRAPERLLVDAPCADAAQSVIREALTNATRHGTGSATLLLDVADQSLHIEVRNPVRRGAPTAAGRAGLDGLRERVLLAGGEITARPEGGDTWLLAARLPVSRAIPTV